MAQQNFNKFHHIYWKLKLEDNFTKALKKQLDSCHCMLRRYTQSMDCSPCMKITIAASQARVYDVL